MWAEYLLLYIETIKSEFETVFVCLLSELHSLGSSASGTDGYAADS